MRARRFARTNVRKKTPEYVRVFRSEAVEACGSIDRVKIFRGAPNMSVSDSMRAASGDRNCTHGRGIGTMLSACSTIHAPKRAQAGQADLTTSGTCTAFKAQATIQSARMEKSPISRRDDAHALLLPSGIGAHNSSPTKSQKRTASELQRNALLTQFPEK
jgi:hypothetical protein